VVAACSDDDDDGAEDAATEASEAVDEAVSEASEAVDEAVTDATEAVEETTEETTEGTATEETTEGTATEETTEGTATDETGGTTAGTGGAGGEGAGGEVGGSACGAPHGPYEEAEEEPAGEVRVAWNDPLLSFNSNTTRGNATANNNPLYLMGAGGFSYYDENLELINNDQFGTCTLDSLDPLTITYTINEGVNWSDGTPVDASDLLLHWAAQSTVFNSADTTVTGNGITAAADAEGNPIVIGPDGTELTVASGDAYTAAFDPEGETGAELLAGYTYKESTGVAFDGSSEALELVTQFPEMSEDGRSITITFDTFYVDYETGGLSSGTPVPAHTVGRVALGVEDPAQAKQAVVDALRADFDSQDPADAADVATIAETWNTGFDATALPADPGLYLSYGPYVLTAYDELSQMTFDANPDYTWGPQPKLATIVYRIIGDPTAAVQALENEEIDIIQPQATADILTQLDALADRGVEVLTDDGAVYEHVDLVFDNGGPFDPATYGGDEATALAVRQAFLKSLPRQEIVERLIVPLNPEAEVRNSFNEVPGSPDYEATVEGNGILEEYGEQDIEGAVQLLADAGVDTSTPIDVRLLFADNNPRRASEYELIRDAAAQAGFNVIDGRSPTWSQDLDNNSLYDASLFGWQTTAIAVADSEANFVTGGLNNLGHYPAERAVDALYEQLKSSTDPEEQTALNTEIESNLVADAFGLPIFQHPAITAYNSTYVDGVSNIAIAPTVFYNVWDWTTPS